MRLSGRASAESNKKIARARTQELEKKADNNDVTVSYNKVVNYYTKLYS